MNDNNPNQDWSQYDSVMMTVLGPVGIKGGEFTYLEENE